MAAEDYIDWGCHFEDFDRPCFVLRDCRLESFTDKALLVKKGDIEDWIPISQVRGMLPRRPKKEIEMIEITEWLSNKTILPFEIEYP